MDEKKILDVVVVGAGPAGVSCAVWLVRLGFVPVLLEASDRVGGLCCEHPYLDGWNATLPDMTGPEVAKNLARSLQLAGVETRLSSPVSKIQSDGSAWRVVVQGNDEPLYARYVVLATGVRARGLQGSGASPQPGVLIGPGTAITQQDFTGKRVAVLGGGDNAFENALYAKQQGAGEVVIFARTVRAQHQFVQQFPAGSVIEGPCTVDARQRQVNGMPWDLILVFYGWEARVPELVGHDLRRTEQGFVQVDPVTTQTNMPGIYAIGEITQRMHPCVVTALADGVTAAKAIQAQLEASALSEAEVSLS